MHTLSSLGSEYDPFDMTIDAKISKNDTYIVSEVNYLLLTFEKRLDKNVAPKIFSANMVSKILNINFKK